MASTRASSPSVQYATPRAAKLRPVSPPSRAGGTSNQTTSPLAASSAATMPRPVLMYSSPSAISGVFCEPLGGVIMLPCRVASGIVDCRQATRRSCTVSASIWSSGAYLVPASSAA